MNITIKDFCANVKKDENDKRKNIFVLPIIQRGFVWSPYQIENLWDSMFRSFPIGSFIVDNLSNHEINILDGQQRASAILLGLNNKNNKTFNIPVNYHLFLDLKKYKDKTNEKKFLFRCITRSHPWGYQDIDNKKTLEQKDRRQAIDIFRKNNILSENEKVCNVTTIDKCYPFDSFLPIPLHYFFESEDINKVIENITAYINNNFSFWVKIHNGKIILNDINWDNYIYDSNENVLKSKDLQQSYVVPTKQLIDYVKEFYTAKRNKRCINTEKVFIDFYSIEEIFKIAKNILSYSLSFINIDNSNNIPEWYTNIDNSKMVPKNISEDDLQIVFKRINTEGKIISADDLNYSLFKSKLFAQNVENAFKIIKQFEKASSRILKPSKAFRIAILLYMQSIQFKVEKSQEEKNKLISLRLKTSQLSKINIDKLVTFINENFINKNYFEIVEDFLLYSSTNEKGLPYCLLKDLCDRAPELIFVLLYRFLPVFGYMDNENKYFNDTKETIIGIILGLFILFKGENQKDYIKLIEYIFPIISQHAFSECWSFDLFERAQLIYPEYELSQVILKPGAKDFVKSELGLINWERKFLLYAQRKSLATWFKDVEFDLEDQNIPFDYDHICAYDFAKTNPSLKNDDIINSIGNLRVLPFELNRHDQNDFINEKFKVENYNEYGKRILEQYNSDTNKKLLEYSLVTDDWLKFAIKNKKILNNTELKNLIIKRIKKIYSEWYNLIKNILRNDENKKLNLKNRLKKEINNINIEIFSQGRANIINSNLVLMPDAIQVEYKEKVYTFTLLSKSENSIKQLINGIKLKLKENKK